MKAVVAVIVFWAILAAGLAILGATFTEAAVGGVAVLIACVVSATLHGGRDDTPSA